MKRCGWTLALSLAACAPLTHPTSGGSASLFVYPRLAPTTQALVPLNDAAAIATLDIVPYIQDASGSYQPISATTGLPTSLNAPDMLKLSQASPSIDPSRPFILKRLKPNCNYRIFGRAYNQANAQISLDNESWADINVGTDDTPAMLTLPVKTLDVPFAATTSLTVATDGRFDYLKSTLYLASTPMTITTTTRANPTLLLDKLQANTTYRLVVEAYKLGSLMASNSANISITNDNAPAGSTISLTIPYVVSTLAGNGSTVFSDGVGTAATFCRPFNLSVDGSGNVYVPEHGGHRVRKITPQGVVTTHVGNGTSGYAEGTGTSAQVHQPTGTFVDNQGNLYLVDHGNQRIRKVNAQGVTSYIAGNGVFAFADGAATVASFNWPTAGTIDAQGNIYISDQLNNRIRKIDTSGNVSTLAGSGASAWADGTGTLAAFSAPIGIAVDPQGNLFIGDNLNNRIRKITPQGVVTTFAGSGVAGSLDGTGTAARFSAPQGIAIDLMGNLYVGEWGAHRIRKIAPSGVVTTLAGNGSTGFANGIGTAATFDGPWGIAVDSQGILYVGDRNNHSVRKLQ